MGWSHRYGKECNEQESGKPKQQVQCQDRHYQGADIRVQEESDYSKQRDQVLTLKSHEKSDKDDIGVEGTYCLKPEHVPKLRAKQLVAFILAAQKDQRKRTD